MKKILMMICLALPVLKMQAQETLSGFHQLVLGASYASVQSLLETKKVMGYMVQKEYEFYKTGDPGDTKEEDYAHNYYKVSATQKKYFTYLQLPVKSVEVMFNEKNELSGIFIVIEKNKKNEGTIKTNAAKKFGNTDCSYGYDEETMQPVTFYCMWVGGGAELVICNWNGIGEMTYEDDIMVEIKSI